MSDCTVNRVIFDRAVINPAFWLLPPANRALPYSFSPDIADVAEHPHGLDDLRIAQILDTKPVLAMETLFASAKGFWVFIEYRQNY